MRVFQVELPSIDAYDWVVGNEEYQKTYGKQREEALARIEQRKEGLTRLGINLLPERNTPVLVTATQLIELSLAGIEHKVVRELKAGADDPTTPNTFMEQFTLMADKLLNLPGLQSGDLPIHNAFNTKCEVHMPGQALATYNETLLLSDSCTDALQDAMDKGWRIIAGCPQPDARRPDYILGRFNPNRDINTGARRDA